MKHRQLLEYNKSNMSDNITLSLEGGAAPSFTLTGDELKSEIRERLEHNTCYDTVEDIFKSINEWRFLNFSFSNRADKYFGEFEQDEIIMNVGQRFGWESSLGSGVILAIPCTRTDQIKDLVNCHEDHYINTAADEIYNAEMIARKFITTFYEKLSGEKFEGTSVSGTFIDETKGEEEIIEVEGKTVICDMWDCWVMDNEVKDFIADRIKEGFDRGRIAVPAYHRGEPIGQWKIKDNSEPSNFIKDVDDHERGTIATMRIEGRLVECIPEGIGTDYCMNDASTDQMSKDIKDGMTEGVLMTYVSHEVEPMGKWRIIDDFKIKNEDDPYTKQGTKLGW